MVRPTIDTISQAWFDRSNIVCPLCKNTVLGDDFNEDQMACYICAPGPKPIKEYWIPKPPRPPKVKLLPKPKKVKPPPKPKSELWHLARELYGAAKASYAANIVSIIIRSAKKRELSVSLTPLEMFLLIQEPCYYCGLEVVFPNHNGIDRVDNSLGYLKENTVSCCPPCNYAKRAQSLDGFRAHITRIYNHFCQKK